MTLGSFPLLLVLLLTDAMMILEHRRNYVHVHSFGDVGKEMMTRIPLVDPRQKLVLIHKYTSSAA